MKKLLKGDGRHYKLATLILCSALLVWCILSPDSIKNLANSLFCLAAWIVKYFAAIFTGKFSIINAPLPYDAIDWSTVSSPISGDQAAASSYFSSSLAVLFNRDFFLFTMAKWGTNASYACRVLMLLSMFVPLAILAGKSYLSPNEAALGTRTKPLKKFDRFDEKVLKPFFSWTKGWMDYLKARRKIIFLMALGFCYRVGLLSFAIDFFSYYFCFFLSFDFSAVFKGFASGAMLLWPLIKFLGWFGVSVLLYLLFDFIRCRIATKKQYEFRDKNKEFIGTLGVTVFLSGPPGTGKTLTNASITRTKEEMNREAIEKRIIVYCRNAFPKFDWATFYGDMESKMKGGDPDFKNLAKVEAWFSENEKEWSEAIKKGDNGSAKKLLWGYDAEKEPRSFYNEYHVLSICEAVKACAEGFFLFRSDRPLIESTYPQQDFYDFSFSDGIIPDIAYKPYNVDYRTTKGRHMCIRMDINTFRLVTPISNVKDNFGNYKTLDPKSTKEVGVIEPLVYSVQEINKIYGNKNDANCNEKNADGFRTAVSIFRHLGTLFNISFVMMIVDSQKMTDTAVALTSRFEDELSIAEADRNFKTTLPLWIFTKWIQEGLIALHDWFLKKYMKSRKDQALFMTLWDRLNHFVFTRYQRRYNRWVYIRERILGTHHINENSAEAEESMYYIIPKDDFGDKYATDNLKQQLNKIKGSKDCSWWETGPFSGLYVTEEDEKTIHSYFNNSIGQ